ncbi:hypothetical protein [Roseibium sp.]|uniref:hypothetical protein n=1 Tax=Roseibium sp. TaxID=1936156 RepID=UPI003A976EFC
MSEEQPTGAKLELSKEAVRSAYLTAEFNALRREIEIQISERRKVESQTFVGLAAIYAWVFTRNPPFDSFYMKITLAIPVVFTIIGLLRWLAIMSRTMVLGAYIRSMEESIVGGELGWETILKKIRDKYPFKGRLEGWVEILTWIISILGTISLFIFGYIFF